MRCCGCLMVYAVLGSLWAASAVVIGPEFAGGVAVGFIVASVLSFGRRL